MIAASIFCRTEVGLAMLRLIFCVEDLFGLFLIDS
jgi:hypothetical protein